MVENITKYDKNVFQNYKMMRNTEIQNAHLKEDNRSYRLYILLYYFKKIKFETIFFCD